MGYHMRPGLQSGEYTCDVSWAENWARCLLHEWRGRLVQCGWGWVVPSAFLANHDPAPGPRPQAAAVHTPSHPLTHSPTRPDGSATCPRQQLHPNAPAAPTVHQRSPPRRVLGCSACTTPVQHVHPHMESGPPAPSTAVGAQSTLFSAHFPLPRAVDASFAGAARSAEGCRPPPALSGPDWPSTPVAHHPTLWARACLVYPPSSSMSKGRRAPWFRPEFVHIARVLHAIYDGLGRIPRRHAPSFPACSLRVPCRLCTHLPL